MISTTTENMRMTVQTIGQNRVQFDSSGGYESAIDMFEEITGQKLSKDTIDKGNYHQDLPDGSSINIRKYSSDRSGNFPTLEIHIKDNGKVIKYIKIRFK